MSKRAKQRPAYTGAGTQAARKCAVPCTVAPAPPPPSPPHTHTHTLHRPTPQGWEVKVWRDYERFIADLTALFPHEREGIRRLYDEFWKARRGWMRDQGLGI